MPTYVSMLRGINVSGQKRVMMGDLRRSYDSLGFQDARTYVQSGNVVFRHPGSDALKVGGEIERGLKRSFGFDVLVFVRTRDELQDLVENTPFSGKDESKLHVTFLSERPAGFPVEEMRRIKEKEEEFSARAREVYLLCPNGYGKTKLSNNFFERKLKVSATTRNWRTVNALLSMANE
ncbi:MAG: DUF1697 domain-containing protein [Thaumarchaeota archaeon]|nr:DUF1697 domain-containing protein [Nitrososphaerota archaeon]